MDQLLFKERLSGIRTARGLNQQDLASKLNISQSAIANYESGEREPNLDTLVSISKVLNVSIDYLLGMCK